MTSPLATRGSHSRFCLGSAPDEGSGQDLRTRDVGIVPMHSLGVRADTLLGDPVKGFPNQLEVLAEVPRAHLAGQLGQAPGLTV